MQHAPFLGDFPVKSRATNHGNSRGSPSIAAAILLRWWRMRCRMKAQDLRHRFVWSVAGLAPDNVVYMAVLLAPSNFCRDSKAPARRPCRLCYESMAKILGLHLTPHSPPRLFPWLVACDLAGKIHQNRSMLQPLLPGPYVGLNPKKSTT